MKKIAFIFFLLIMIIGVVGYAARLDNDYQHVPNAALSSLSNATLSEKPPKAAGSERLQTMTFAILFGTGLVGMVTIKRK